eukprot:1463545-Prymnesium_polylepis.1
MLPLCTAVTRMVARSMLSGSGTSRRSSAYLAPRPAQMGSAARASALRGRQRKAHRARRTRTISLCSGASPQPKASAIIHTPLMNFTARGGRDQ